MKTRKILTGRAREALAELANVYEELANFAVAREKELAEAKETIRKLYIEAKGGMEVSIEAPGGAMMRVVVPTWLFERIVTEAAQCERGISREIWYALKQYYSFGYLDTEDEEEASDE